MAIEVTPEMRQAVLEEMCAERGHQLSLDALLGQPLDDMDAPVGPMQPLGPEEGKLPFIHCAHCNKVLGIFIAIEGRGYDEVEERVAGMLRDRTQLDARRRPKRPKSVPRDRPE